MNLNDFQKNLWVSGRYENYTGIDPKQRGGEIRGWSDPGSARRLSRSVRPGLRPNTFKERPTRAPPEVFEANFSYGYEKLAYLGPNFSYGYEKLACLGPNGRQRAKASRLAGLASLGPLGDWLLKRKLEKHRASGASLRSAPSATGY